MIGRFCSGAWSAIKNEPLLSKQLRRRTAQTARWTQSSVLSCGACRIVQISPGIQDFSRHLRHMKMLTRVVQLKAKAAAKRRWRSQQRSASVSAAERYQEAAGDVLSVLQVRRSIVGSSSLLELANAQDQIVVSGSAQVPCDALAEAESDAGHTKKKGKRRQPNGAKVLANGC